MVRLSSAVLMRAHRFLLKINATNDVETQRRLIPDGLKRLLSCDRADFNTFEVGKTGLIIPAAMRAYWENLAPLFRKHLREQVFSAAPLRDPAQYKAVAFYNRRQDRVWLWKNSICYHECYLPVGATLQMAVIHFHGHPVRYDRNAKCCRRDFTAGDCALVELIGPHVVWAWRNASELSQLRKRQVLTTSAADLGEHTAVIDCGAEAIAALSPGARAALRKYFDQDVHEGCAIPNRLSRWLAAQRKLLESKDAFIGAPQTLCSHSGATSLIVSVMQPTPGVALVVLKEISNVAASHVNSLAGCTRRETEILHWVAEGKTNQEIATILELSSRTVGKHLEHVFEKLGVTTRTAAAHAAFESGTWDHCYVI